MQLFISNIVQIFVCRVDFQQIVIHRLTYRYPAFLSPCERSVNANHLSTALICEFRPCAISLLAGSTNSSLHSSFMLSYFWSRERPIQPLHTRPGASFSLSVGFMCDLKGCVCHYFVFSRVTRSSWKKLKQGFAVSVCVSVYYFCQ